MKNLTTLKNFVLLIGATAAFTACHKDKDNVPTPSRTELLTAKNWRVTAITATATVNGSVIVQDGYLTYLPCERDDFIKFNPDKTALQDAGATKCNPQESQTDTTSWAFNADETELLLDTSASPVESLTIVELSTTTLHLRKTASSNGSAVSAVVDITYTAF